MRTAVVATVFVALAGCGYAQQTAASMDPHERALATTRILAALAAHGGVRLRVTIPWLADHPHELAIFEHNGSIVGAGKNLRFALGAGDAPFVCTTITVGPPLHPVRACDFPVAQETLVEIASYRQLEYVHPDTNRYETVVHSAATTSLGEALAAAGLLRCPSADADVPWRGATTDGTIEFDIAIPLSQTSSAQKRSDCPALRGPANDVEFSRGAGDGGSAELTGVARASGDTLNVAVRRQSAAGKRHLFNIDPSGVAVSLADSSDALAELTALGGETSSAPDAGHPGLETAELRYSLTGVKPGTYRVEIESYGGARDGAAAPLVFGDFGTVRISTE